MKKAIWNLLVGIGVGTLSVSAMAAFDAGLVGPNGEVILFYKNGDQVVIRECEDHTLLKNYEDATGREDCHPKSETSVPILDFRNTLHAVLLHLPVGDYEPEMERKIRLYRKGKLDDIAGLEAKRAELQLRLDRIQAFIDAKGEENADLQVKRKTEEELEAVVRQLTDNQDLASAIREINDRVNRLVDHVISSPKLKEFLFSKEKHGFEFNVLKSYLDTPGLNPQFKEIVAGSFKMGSPKGEGGEADREQNEEPHTVELTEGFSIQTTEVTQLQWFSEMKENPSSFVCKNKPDHWEPGIPQRCAASESYCPESYLEIDGWGMCSDYPVEKVSWTDVQVFIERLNEKQGQYEYRLPTEAEWEYAARAGSTSAFNLGDNISPALVNYDGNYPYENAQKGEYLGQPVAVASLPNANNWGLFDMHGNVWEWVEDSYEPDLGSSKVVDPLIDKGDGSYRVIRGGCWGGSARSCRSADRYDWRPGYRVSSVGFRLVRTPK